MVAWPGCSGSSTPSRAAASSVALRICWVSVSDTSSSIASGGAGKPAIVAARSMVCGSTPSSSSAAASVSSVPKTREV